MFPHTARQPKSSLPRACGILSKTSELRDGRLERTQQERIGQPSLKNLLGHFHLFSQRLHRERECLGAQKCSCKANTTFTLFCSPASHGEPTAAPSTRSAQNQPAPCQLGSLGSPRLGSCSVCGLSQWAAWMEILEVAPTRAQRSVPKPALRTML